MTDREVLVEVASRIGARLVREAIWDDSRCTWYVMTHNQKRGSRRRATRTIAPGMIYQGTAGIALFLGELYTVNPRKEFKRAAEAGLRHAFELAKELPNSSYGFYSGRVGIAFALARLATVFDEECFINMASDVLQPLIENEDNESAIDVIGGAAGAIPALLQLTHNLNDEKLAQMARKLGDHLMDLAHKEPIGWSWRTVPYSSMRNLCGYAHGAAGVGHAFMELFSETGVGKYLYAAEQAFLYERQFLDQERSNWPDFRHTELGEYLAEGRIDELREDLKHGILPSYSLKYMAAWCHGAPGIGLTRARAFGLLRKEIYKQETGYAIRSVRLSIQDPRSNFSLCHGIGGNCELLILTADLFHDPALREDALQCALRGWEDYESRGLRWPCGTEGAITDPSLLLGEAGIGYYYLRLYSKDTPSILFVTSSRSALPNTINHESYKKEQCAYIHTYFDNSFRALELCKSDQSKLNTCSQEFKNPIESDVSAIYEMIVTAVGKNGEKTDNVLIRDSVLLERSRYELALTITDFTEEMLHRVKSMPAEEISWGEVVIKLAPHVRLVTTHCKCDGDTLVQVDQSQSVSEENELHWLLYRKDNKIEIRRIDHLSSLVLSCVQRPCFLVEVLRFVRMALSTQGVLNEELLQQKVIAQLSNAYQVHLVDCEAGLEGFQ